jgi:uncharacterized protein YchJ
MINDAYMDIHIDEVLNAFGRCWCGSGRKFKVVVGVNSSGGIIIPY